MRAEHICIYWAGHHSLVLTLATLAPGATTLCSTLTKQKHRLKTLSPRHHQHCWTLSTRHYIIRDVLMMYSWPLRCVLKLNRMELWEGFVVVGCWNLFSLVSDGVLVMGTGCDHSTVSGSDQTHLAHAWLQSRQTLTSLTTAPMFARLSSPSSASSAWSSWWCECED